MVGWDGKRRRINATNAEENDRVAQEVFARDSDEDDFFVDDLGRAL